MTELERWLLDRIVATEGGYVHHPADKGGPTHFGITAATLGAWRGLGRDATAEEVEALSLDEAEAIYLAWWIRHRALSLHLLADRWVAWAIHDAAVLFSRARAARWAQEAAGGLAVDGWIGPLSVARINTRSRAQMLVGMHRLRVERHAQRCKEDRSQVAFLEGWLARACRTLTPLIGDQR